MAGLGPKTLIRRCAQLGPCTPSSAAAHTLHLLARRIQQLTEQIDDLHHRLEAVITAHNPQLLKRVGIGPDNAATLLVTAGDNPDRLRSEASFATLCGASPVSASSSKTYRKRLNCGGDRQTNSALYRTVICRLCHDPDTRAYRDRRTAEGRSNREIIRCLKRYVAREVHQMLKPTPTPHLPPPDRLTNIGASKCRVHVMVTLAAVVRAAGSHEVSRGTATARDPFATAGGLVAERQ
jgi:transposase